MSTRRRMMTGKDSPLYIQALSNLENRKATMNFGCVNFSDGEEVEFEIKHMINYTGRFVICSCQTLGIINGTLCCYHTYPTATWNFRPAYFGYTYKIRINSQETTWYENGSEIKRMQNNPIYKTSNYCFFGNGTNYSEYWITLPCYILGFRKYKRDKLVADCKPAIYKNEVGLFDTINKVMYTEMDREYKYTPVF